MKRTFILLTILLIGFTKVFSCECNRILLKNEIDFADLIFQGIPFAKKQIDSKMIYLFLVEKIWKGEKSDTIEIKTGRGGGDCGMIFELGRQYVVFSKHLETSSCSKNNLIDSTFDDLKLDFKFSTDFSIAFIDNEKKLNSKESEYLNQQFGKIFQNYDFTGKSILFTYSTDVSTKTNWIESILEFESPSVELVILTEEEKKLTGYDAIIVTWYKFNINEKTKNKILKQIQ